MSQEIKALLWDEHGGSLAGWHVAALVTLIAAAGMLMRCCGCH